MSSKVRTWPPWTLTVLTASVRGSPVEESWTTSSRSPAASWRSSSGARSARRRPARGVAPGLCSAPAGAGLADRARAAGLEQRLGRAVDQPNDMIVVHRDDAGGHPRQHRLGEGAATVQMGEGAEQGRGLLLEPAGHPVEGAAERADLVARLRHRNPRRKIA